MKHLLILISLTLFLVSKGFCAIPATCQWDCQTGGNNNNGGGYVSGGTDHSQTTSAYLTITDLTAVQTSVTFQVKSTLTPFNTSCVGNIINITAGTGWTAGRYEVTAVDTSTPPIATVDSTFGSVSSANAGTAYLGGTLGVPTTASLAAMVAGNTLWVKYGTFSVGATITPPTVGTRAAPLNFIGYNTTHGDTPTGTNRPTLALGAYVFSSFGGGPPFGTIQNLIFTGTGGKCLYLFRDCFVLSNCKATNTSGYANESAFEVDGQTTGNYIFLNCEGVCTNGYAFCDYSSSFFDSYMGIYAHSSAYGIYLSGSGAPVTVVKSVISNITTTGIYSTIVAILVDSTTVDSCVTGISLQSISGNSQITNTIFSNDDTGLTANNAIGYANHNDFYNCGTPYGGSAIAGANDITLNPQYVSSSTGNYAIGTNLSGVGFPGPLASSTGYESIGAVKPQYGVYGNTAPAGGGQYGYTYGF